jgi:hypothetical protein
MLISEGSAPGFTPLRKPLGKQVNPSLVQFISANHVALAAGCAAGIGMCLFFCGVQVFARTDSSGSAARVSVGAAMPGPAAISGKAVGPRTLAAPISGKPCYIYRASIWQLEPGGNREWKNVAEETGHLTFLIEDETGQLLVEPGGAELDLRQSLSEEYGGRASSSSKAPDPSPGKEAVPDTVANFLARNGITPDRPTRVEEYCLEPETRVVVTGTVIQNGEVQADSLASASAATSGDHPLDVAKALGDPLALQPQIIRLASGTAPQSTAHMSQQAKIAAALARAGLATPDMWATGEGGLQAINSLIDSHSRIAQSPPDPNPDASATPALALTPTTTVTTTMTTMIMTKGPDDPTFIISNHAPAKPTALGWKSVALVLAGSTLTTLSLYVLLLAHLR